MKVNFMFKIENEASCYWTIKENYKTGWNSSWIRKEIKEIQKYLFKGARALQSIWINQRHWSCIVH
jgi:hypothetical protein